MNARRRECVEFAKRQVCKAIIKKKNNFEIMEKTLSLKNRVVGYMCVK